MLKHILVLVLVACVIAEDPEVEVDEGVLVLTQDNFDSVVEGNDYVLVEFYAPWCGHCKKLAPEYAKAAQKLADEDSPVKLAKVDATEQKELGSKYGVKGYPTLKFFTKGKPMDYGGGRTTDTIVSWVTKKSGPPAVTITESAQAEKLMEKDVAIIGYFKDVESKEAKDFLSVAMMNDDFAFGICSDAEIMKAYDVEKEGVALFKKFDEKRADLTDDLSLKSIREFVEAKSTALFAEFTQEGSQKLFANKDMPLLFLATSKKADTYEKFAEVFTKVAEENLGKMKVVLLNTDNSAATQVIKYLDMKPEDYPAYKILHLGKGLKYRPEDSDITLEKVSAFASAYMSGDLKPFLKTEEVPEDWDSQNVKVLVGKNFKEVALDEKKHVFVEFYAPWCGHCKKLAPIWDELAATYAGSEDVVIAKMDSTMNEVEEVSVRGFPTLKFFPAGGAMQDYNGERELEPLIKFVSKFSAPPAKEEEEPETPADSKEDEMKKDEL